MPFSDGKNRDRNCTREVKLEVKHQHRCEICIPAKVWLTRPDGRRTPTGLRERRRVEGEENHHTAQVQTAFMCSFTAALCHAHAHTLTHARAHA